jgi:hypothetical protein
MAVPLVIPVLGRTINFTRHPLRDQHIRACPKVVPVQNAALPVCDIFVEGRHHEAWVVCENIHLGRPTQRRMAQDNQGAQGLAYCEEVDTRTKVFL